MTTGSERKRGRGAGARAGGRGGTGAVAVVAVLSVCGLVSAEASVAAPAIADNMSPGVVAAAQDLSQYEALKAPRIARMPAMRMLVVDIKGDPSTAGPEAFGLLFKTFFGLPGAMLIGAPRGRWTIPAGEPKSRMSGTVALPLPSTVKGLAPGATGVRIEEWAYGDVAEILHVGSYADEPPTIERLQKFIAAQGYEIAGPHEEEYLRGPGQAASPAEYWTIIRYQVKKKGASSIPG